MEREEIRTIENFAFAFFQLKENLSENDHVFSPKDFMELISLMIKDETAMLILNFTFAYYAIKRELSTPEKEQDAIESMKELLGWELESNKRFVQSYHYMRLGQKYEKEGDLKNALDHFRKALDIDETNVMIYYYLSELCEKQQDLVRSERYRKMGINVLIPSLLPEMTPSEHFNRLFQQFQQKSKVFQEKIPKKYSAYFDEPIDNSDTLFAMQQIMEKFLKYLEGDRELSPKILIKLIDVLIDDYFEWISLVAGLAYFNLKDGVGSQEEIGELLDAIKNILGMEKHHSLDQESINVQNSKAWYESRTIKKFKINDYMTIRLIKGKEKKRTLIFVKNLPFDQCNFLMLDIPIDEVQFYDEIDSIDEAADRLGWTYEGQEDVKYTIDPESEFWGHCSNLQAWTENDYDTRILHSNLSFPLLRKLAEVGDPLARRVLKDEIGKRFESGYPTVVACIIKEGMLDLLTEEERSLLISENIHVIFRIIRDVHYQEDVHDLILEYFSLFLETIDEMKLQDQYHSFYRLVQTVQGSEGIRYIDSIVAKFAFLLENIEKVRDIDIQDGEMDCLSCIKEIARILGVEKEVFFEKIETNSFEEACEKLKETEYFFMVFNGLDDEADTYATILGENSWFTREFITQTSVTNQEIPRIKILAGALSKRAWQSNIS